MAERGSQQPSTLEKKTRNDHARPAAGSSEIQVPSKFKSSSIFSMLFLSFSFTLCSLFHSLHPEKFPESGPKRVSSATQTRWKLFYPTVHRSHHITDCPGGLEARVQQHQILRRMFSRFSRGGVGRIPRSALYPSSITAQRRAQ